MKKTFATAVAAKVLLWWCEPAFRRIDGSHLPRIWRALLPFGLFFSTSFFGKKFLDWFGLVRIGAGLHGEGHRLSAEGAESGEASDTRSKI